MIGAIIGDIVASTYATNPVKTKEFPLFLANSHCTAITVANLAIADAIMSVEEYRESIIQDRVRQALKSYGKRHKKAFHNPNRLEWIESENNEPYINDDDMSCLSVSCISWMINDIQQVRAIARMVASVTSKNEIAIKNAEAIASAIFLARMQSTRDEIQKYMEEEFDIYLSENKEDIIYSALLCFIRSKTFEDAITNAIISGGDCSKRAVITGSIARAFYDVSVQLEVQAFSRLPSDLMMILDKYNQKIHHPNPFFTLNQIIVKEVHEFTSNPNNQTVARVLECFRYIMNLNGGLLISSLSTKENNVIKHRFKILKTTKGDEFYAVFSDVTQLNKEQDKQVMIMSVSMLFNKVLEDQNIKGFIFNPWKEKFVITKEMIQEIDRVNRKNKESVN